LERVRVAMMLEVQAFNEVSQRAVIS
jgi:hypothetical protein